MQTANEVIKDIVFELKNNYNQKDKISMIKRVRQQSSKLIEIGIVPKTAISDNDFTSLPVVGLGFAKEFVEYYIFDIQPHWYDFSRITGIKVIYRNGCSARVTTYEAIQRMCNWYGLTIVQDSDSGQYHNVVDSLGNEVGYFESYVKETTLWCCSCEAECLTHLVERPDGLYIVSRTNRPEKVMFVDGFNMLINGRYSLPLDGDIFLTNYLLKKYNGE